MGTIQFKKDDFENIVEALSDLKNGHYWKRAKPQEDENLNLLANKINELAISLEVQAQDDLQLRKLINSVPDMLGYWDADLLNVHANNAYYKFFGKSPNEIFGKHIRELLGEEVYKKNEPHFKAVLDGLPQIFERELPFASGKGSRPCLTKYIPDFINNRVAGFFVVVTDLTELKRMDQNYKAVIETLGEGVVLQNRKAEIIEFNQNACTILGLTEDQLVGRTSFDPRWKAIKEDGSDFDGSEHPAIVALKTGKSVAGVIMGIKLPSGETRWLNINANPYKIHKKNSERAAEDTESKEQMVVCTFTDISNIKSREDELRFILKSLKIGIWKLNPVNQSLTWDKSMYELFEINEQDFTGDYQAWENTLTTESKTKAIEELNKALSGEKEFNTVFEIKTKSSGRRSISGIGKVDRDQSGNALMMYGINMDCTDSVLREQEIQRLANESRRNAKLASLGELSAGIAHEINNPLAIIDGSLELISKYRENPEKFAAKVDGMKKATHRISRIIQSLKKFSRSDSKPMYQNHKLGEIINDAVILTEAKSKKHDTSVSVESHANIILKCDEIEIEQVLVNLINNAIDAISDRSEKWIKISYFEEGPAVVVRITDSGPGIPESVRNKLFDPFFTTKETGEGTGLGLSITKGILDEHDATISVLDTLPNTCFEIRFHRKEEIKRVN